MVAISSYVSFVEGFFFFWSEKRGGDRTQQLPDCEEICHDEMERTVCAVAESALTFKIS